MIDIENLKKRCGYNGKPQQWKYGFDLAIREIAKAQAVPEGYCLVPKEPTEVMERAGFDKGAGFLANSIYKAMVEASESGAEQ